MERIPILQIRTYVGEDTFEYQVCDGGNPSLVILRLFILRVQPVGSPDNDPPVANADTNTTQVDTPVDGTVLPNDYDPDDDPISVTANTPPTTVVWLSILMGLIPIHQILVL